MIERRTIEGGIDCDSAPEFVAKSDYLNMYNMRVGKDSAGRGGAGKPIAGTQQRSTDAATGTKQTIGSITDEVKGRLYRFNFNSNGTDKILAWDRKTNTTYTVLQSSNMVDGLGFLTAYPITGIALIGDYLYWTDNINEPRRIDVERGIRTNHPTYTSQNGNVPEAYDTPLNEWDITVARRVPRIPLKWEKLISSEEADVPDQPYGYLDRNGIQFAFRYVYSTNEVSTLGGYSTIAAHNGDSKFNRYAYKYDTIRVAMDKDEEIDAEVQKVEFFARRDNIGSWYLVKTIDREQDPNAFTNHNTVGEPEMSFYFYNNELGVPIPDQEAYLPFFDVPILSNSLEIADNRCFLGNNTKGYDYVVGEPLTLTLRDYTWPSGTTWRLFADYYLIEWSCGTGIAEKVILRVGEWFGPAAGWYDTSFTAAQFNAGTLPLSITIDPADKFPIVDNDDVPVELIEYLNPTCPTYTFTAYPNNPAIITDNGLGTVSENAKTFRKGKKYKVGIQFFDYAGRNAGVHHEIAEVDIPEPTVSDFTHTIGIDWEIDTAMTIPLWAHSYSIVRNRITEQFLSDVTFFIRYAAKEDDGTYTFESGTPAAPNLDYAITWDAIGFNIDRFVQYRGIGYTFSDGDLIKLVTLSGDIYFLKIIGTYLGYIMTENYNIGTITGAGDYYMEIITPKVEPDEFWEVGKSYLITNPGTPTRDFSVTSGTLTGETFLTRWDDRPQSSLIQCMNPNNKYWFIWPQDYGRPTSLIFSEQRRYETEVAWSSTYFPGTETNQLNQFLSNDIRTLDSGLGQIQILRLTSRTQDYGTVMLAVGQTEVASIYLGRTEFYNAAETPSLINTVDVIGTINILRGGFGTLNPESFVENDGDAYWYSAIKSAFVRYSKAGVEPISDRKFSVFAAWLGNLILSTANDVPGISTIKIPAGYDDFNKEAVWTIPPIGNWPISYQVMSDVEEDITVTESPVGSVTASLVAGAVYRFTFIAAGPTQVGVTCNDLFFGTKTFNSVGTQVSFLFTAASTGNYTFAVTTTPALPTVVHSYSLKKLRLDPYNVLDRYPKTVVFSDEKGRFSWFLNAVPEWWGRIGDRLLSMKLGNLFSHDATTTNSFYGVRYPSNVSIAFNEKPNQVKRLQGVSMEATGQPAYVHFRTEDDFTQSSDLVSTEFRKQEGIWSASARRDRLSPNTPGTVIDKLLKGDEMRGRYVKTLLEWSSLTTFVLKIANLIYRDSPGSKT